MDRRGPSKIFLVLLVLLALPAVFYFVDTESAPFQKTVKTKSKPIPVRFVDDSGIVSHANAGMLNLRLQWAYLGYGIDMRYLLVRSTEGQSLEEYAVAKARAMGVGSATGGRGILCVYDAADQRMRIEVGPKLEGVLTDAFVSYLERENTHAYVTSDDLALGLNLTMQLIVRRLQEAELGEDYDPRPAQHILDARLLAEGAGATAAMDANSAGSGVVNRDAPPEILRKYPPQPSVEEAWQKYLEWESEPYEYMDVPLLTADSQEFLRKEPMSRAYFDFILMGDYGQPHVVEQQGDLAMMVFTHTPFISPYYFRRTPDGWQIDVMGAIRNSEELMGNIFTWRWRDGHDDYSRAFSDQVIVVDNFLRVSGSDNRPLPVHVTDAP